jgi:hypothetical protein
MGASRVHPDEVEPAVPTVLYNNNTAVSRRRTGEYMYGKCR